MPRRYRAGPRGKANSEERTAALYIPGIRSDWIEPPHSTDANRGHASNQSLCLAGIAQGPEVKRTAKSEPRPSTSLASDLTGLNRLTRLTRIAATLLIRAYASPVSRRAPR